MHGGARSRRGDTRKSPSAAVNKVGERGSHWVRLVQRERKGGRRGKRAGETSGVRVDDGGREASGVAHKSPEVRDKEGGAQGLRSGGKPMGVPPGSGWVS